MKSKVHGNVMEFREGREFYSIQPTSPSPLYQQPDPRVDCS